MLDEQNFTDVIDEHFGYDGPHSPETARDAARGIAKLVRYLNNATGPGSGTESLPYAPHTYRLLGSVHATVHGLDQLLDQIVTAMNRHANDPTLRDDRGANSDAGATAQSAVEALDEARRTLALSRPRLDEAWAASGHLGHDLEAGR